MRRNIVIIGIIISAIAVLLVSIGVTDYRDAIYNKMWDSEPTGRYDETISMFDTIGIVGIILLSVSIPLAIIGLVMNSKEQKNLNNKNKPS